MPPLPSGVRCRLLPPSASPPIATPGYAGVATTHREGQAGVVAQLSPLIAQGGFSTTATGFNAPQIFSKGRGWRPYYVRYHFKYLGSSTRKICKHGLVSRMMAFWTGDNPGRHFAV